MVQVRSVVCIIYVYHICICLSTNPETFSEQICLSKGILGHHRSQHHLEYDPAHANVSNYDALKIC